MTYCPGAPALVERVADCCTRAARARRQALKFFLFQAKSRPALVTVPARSLGPSQLVLVEDLIPGGDHLCQDYVHVFLVIILVPKHKELSVLRERERQQ